MLKRNKKLQINRNSTSIKTKWLPK